MLYWQEGETSLSNWDTFKKAPRIKKEIFHAKHQRTLGPAPGRGRLWRERSFSVARSDRSRGKADVNCPTHADLWPLASLSPWVVNLPYMDGEGGHWCFVSDSLGPIPCQLKSSRLFPQLVHHPDRDSLHCPAVHLLLPDDFWQLMKLPHHSQRPQHCRRIPVIDSNTVTVSRKPPEKERAAACLLMFSRNIMMPNSLLNSVFINIPPVCVHGYWHSSAAMLCALPHRLLLARAGASPLFLRWPSEVVVG